MKKAVRQNFNKTSVTLKKTSESVQSTGINAFQDVMQLMDSIYDMRFIQKVSRPINRQQKAVLVQKMSGKLQALHSKLQRIRQQVFLQARLQKSGESKKKSLESTTDRPLDFKQSVRKIQSRYIQIFLEGSFKHYKKLKMLNHFTEQLQLINIEEWTTSCLHKNKSTNQCC